MRTHYLHYLKGIKDNYLGRTWQISMNRKYESQSFQQEGYERESPPAFIVHQIMFTCMLVASDDGGPTEVYLVMQKAPISWGPILNLETIRSTSLLYSRATDHELALVHAAKYESSNIITVDNLLYTLRKLRIATDRSCPMERSAKLVLSKSSNSEPEEDIIHEAFLGQLSREECTQEINLDPKVMKEAFQVLKKRQRPPPKGGYPYAKNDHVTTKMGRLPPSPCKVCGSNNHWDKECPDWSFYEAKQLKAAYRIETNEDEDLEGYYSSVYSVLVTERMTLENKQGSIPDFREAVLEGEDTSLSRERKSDESTLWRKQTVFMEEVEDQAWLDYKAKEKATTCLMHEVGFEYDEPLMREAHSVCQARQPQQEQSSDSSPTEDKTSQGDIPTPSTRPNEVKDPPEEIEDPTANAAFQPPPPTKEKLMRVPKVRSHPEGMSAIGVSVLSTRGFVGGLNNVETDL